MNQDIKQGNPEAISPEPNNTLRQEPIEIYKGKETDGNRLIISKEEDSMLKWVSFDGACRIIGLKSHDAVRDRCYNEAWRNKLVKEGRNTRRYFLEDDVIQSRNRDMEKFAQGVSKGLESPYGSTPEVSSTALIDTKDIELLKKISPLMDSYKDLQKTLQEKNSELLKKEESIGEFKERTTKYRILSKTGWICLGISLAAIGLIFAFNVPNKFWREKETITVTKEVPVIKKETEIKLIPVDKETYEALKTKGLITKFETAQPGNESVKNGQPLAGANENGIQINPGSNLVPKNNTERNGSTTGNGDQK